MQHRCVQGIVLSILCLAPVVGAQVTVLDQPVDAAGQPASGFTSDEGCDPVTAGSFGQSASKADNFTVAAAVDVDTVTLWGQFLDQSGGPLNATPRSDSWSEVTTQRAGRDPGVSLRGPCPRAAR